MKGKVNTYWGWGMHNEGYLITSFPFVSYPLKILNYHRKALNVMEYATHRHVDSHRQAILTPTMKNYTRPLSLNMVSLGNKRNQSSLMHMQPF